ncbi:MAG: hypothetical protein AB1422_13220 [bacterium]
MNKRISKFLLTIITILILFIPIFSTGDDETKPQPGDVFFRTDNVTP